MNSSKSSTKYVGMDVHSYTITVVVKEQSGKELMASTILTRREVILEFISGLRGKVQVAFEEGTHAAWLYDLLLPVVSKVVVCNRRKNKTLHSGIKNDLADARGLADLLRAGMLHGVYHGQNSVGTLKELGRTYLALTSDLTRVMARIKAVYRSQAIAARGKELYSPRHRQQWIDKLSHKPELRQRVGYLFQQLDALRPIRRQARKQMIEESKKVQALECLSSIPFLGPIRLALLIGKVQTPHRFRNKRQFWAYCGLGLETSSSADYAVIEGQIQRRKKAILIRGLNFHHCAELKNIFKAAATTASARSGPFRQYYEQLLSKGMRTEMARLTLARKMAATTLALWKKGERFDSQQLLNRQAV